MTKHARETYEIYSNPYESDMTRRGTHMSQTNRVMYESEPHLSRTSHVMTRPRRCQDYIIMTHNR